MLSWMLARGARAVAITLVAGAVVLGLPVGLASGASPHRKGTASGTVLKEGLGMRTGPSVRVRALQRKLVRAGFHIGATGADGRFGRLTARAVRRLQRHHALRVDGVVGRRTRHRLNVLARRGAAAAARRATAHRRAAARRRHRAAGAAHRRGSGHAPPTHAQTPATAGTKGGTGAPGLTGATTQVQVSQGTSAGTGQTQQGTGTPVSRQPSAVTDPPGTHTQVIAAPGDRDGAATILAVLAAMLALAAAAIALLRRREPGPPPLVAIRRDLLLEGRTTEGTFRGKALIAAAKAGAEFDSRETRFLIDDPSKPVPIWVSGRDVDRTPTALPPGSPVIGYVTIGVDEQESQRQLEALCEESGWRLQCVVRDEETDRLLHRPGLSHALDEIATGRARALILADTKGVTRSMADLAALLQWLEDAGAHLIVPELALDTTTMLGKQTARTLITLSDHEEMANMRPRPVRRTIGARTAA